MAGQKAGFLSFLVKACLHLGVSQPEADLFRLLPVRDELYKRLAVFLQGIKLVEVLRRADGQVAHSPLFRNGLEGMGVGLYKQLPHGFRLAVFCIPLYCAFRVNRCVCPSVRTREKGRVLTYSSGLLSSCMVYSNQ